LEPVGYQIVHSIAGRIRIRVPWLETDAQAASNYQRLVEGLSDVKAVRINPLAQSIVVEYNPRALSVSKMEEMLISVMQQVKLTPPAAAPTVEHEVEPIDEPSVSSNSPAEPTIESPPKPSPTMRSIVPEIPSPWDEESSNHSAIPEPTPEESFTTQETMMTNPICSTASLAQRLKVTSQAITRRRTKSDFGQWTQAQDPEGIAWNYHEHDRSFRPVSVPRTVKEIE